MENQSTERTWKNKPILPHCQAIMQQVTEWYKHIIRVPNVLAGLLKHDISNLLEKPTKYLTRWLQIAFQVPLNERVQKQRRKGIGQDICKYLPMASKPPDQTQKKNQTLTSTPPK